MIIGGLRQDFGNTVLFHPDRRICNEAAPQTDKKWYADERGKRGLRVQNQRPSALIRVQKLDSFVWILMYEDTKFDHNTTLGSPGCCYQARHCVGSSIPQ